MQVLLCTPSPPLHTLSTVVTSFVCRTSSTIMIGMLVRGFGTCLAVLD